ncbi:MAG: hypothetical protein KKB34_11545 [Bacteroidetes bacterium]|nr:hypothetical protein [Bacteroidota bacterium]
MALKESLQPVRPGIPDSIPFWNKYSTRFIYAPAFEFKKFGKVKYYLFTALSFADKKEYSFKSENEYDPLSPIWADIPVGEVFLKVEACDNTGPVGLSGVRKFYKAAPFPGIEIDIKNNGEEELRKLLSYFYNLDYIQRWADTGTPDSNYILYCYPSKNISTVIKGMLLYIKYFPNNRDRALKIAQNAADYLIGISEPESSNLAGWPPTYTGNKLTSKVNNGNIMVSINAQAGNYYLDLYEVTKNEKYLNAAVEIADTYVNTQLPSGTWYVKLKTPSGEPFAPNLAIPISILNFLERLTSEYRFEKYQVVVEKSFQWIINYPVQDYNWEGQFEDAYIQGEYENLAMHDPCNTAIYLLKNSDKDRNFINKAEEIIRFVEDQFVVWSKPLPYWEHRSTSSYLTPSVLEQYQFYVPVDASLSKVVATYSLAYQVTKNPIYFAKKKVLHAALLKNQAEDGSIPTGWWDYSSQLWINCLVYDAIVLDYITFGGKIYDTIY